MLASTQFFKQRKILGRMWKGGGGGETENAWLKMSVEIRCSCSYRKWSYVWSKGAKQGWVRCGARLEVRKSVELSRGWVGLKPHCKSFFPLRQAKLDGSDGTGLRGGTQGHFITESVCPEDGKRIILQTGFIAGDNSLAEPTVEKCHIGWGYNIASFTAPNSLIFSNACRKVWAWEWSWEHLYATVSTRMFSETHEVCWSAQVQLQAALLQLQQIRVNIQDR